jgi:Arc/MetJ-type ribon-helix-helix transcriptional regulator
MPIICHTAAMAERVQTLIQLNRELLAKLDERARRRGVSRSELVRELLSAALREDDAARRSRQMRDGYERVPQAQGRDAWGDLDAWTAANARRNRAALSAEEGAEHW